MSVLTSSRVTSNAATIELVKFEISASNNGEVTTLEISIVTTSPVMEGVEDGMRVEGISDGSNVGKEDGVDVINRDCISTPHSSPVASLKFSIDAFTSGIFVASTTRFTSA